MGSAPIVLFVCKRSGETRKVLESLRADEGGRKAGFGVFFVRRAGIAEGIPSRHPVPLHAEPAFQPPALAKECGRFMNPEKNRTRERVVFEIEDDSVRAR